MGARSADWTPRDDDSLHPTTSMVEPVLSFGFLMLERLPVDTPNVALSQCPWSLRPLGPREAPFQWRGFVALGRS